MISEIHLLQLLSTRENFTKFHETIKPHVLTDEGNLLVKEISLYYDTFPKCDSILWPEFATWFQTIRHPTWDPTRKAIYERVFMELMEISTSVPTSVDIVTHFQTQDKLARLIDTR
jgi:hypothetical protein